MPVVNAVVPLDKITPHSQNYNAHPEEQIHQLGASYTALGQFRSVVLWQQEDGTYIQLAGHGVVEAMKREGAREVRADIHPPSLDPLTAKQIMLADNLHAHNSSPDDEMLASLLQEQQDAGFGLTALGTDDEALRQMLEALGDDYAGSDEADGEEDTIPEEEETRCKPGDIWQLGRHKIIVEDSFNTQVLDVLMADEKADLLLCDPPYGMDFDPGMSALESRKGGWVSKPRFYDKIVGDAKDFDPLPLTDYFSYCKEQFWWGADYYADKILCRNDGAWFVWDKREGIEGMEFSTSAFELCWSKQKHSRQIVRQRWSGLLGTETQDVRSRVHPTQKPLQVCNFFIGKYSDPNDLVVDLFLGSGTTLISAERLGRRCFGCEIKPEFADVILARYEAETGETATLLERSGQVSHAESAS